MKTFKPIQRFNDHGASCKGHANFMLDSTYEDEDDRKALILALNSSINSIQIDIRKEEQEKLFSSMKGKIKTY